MTTAGNLTAAAYFNYQWRLELEFAPHTYWHKDCRKNFTVKTGTVMHASKTKTQNWLIAMYSVLTARKGVSAMQLSKELGVQYKTAWYMLHRNLSTTLRH